MDSVNSSKEADIESIFPIELPQETILDVVIKSKDCSERGLVKVISYNIAPADNDLGLSGDYYSLSVTFKTDEKDGECNQQFFIKTLPVRYPMERNRVKYLKLFDREKIMYATMNRLESEIKQNWRPNFYFANDSLLVMEDIKKMNFQCLSTSQISPELTKACLEQLAQLHAKGIAENILKGISYFQKDSPLNDGLLETYNPWVQTGFMAIQALALKDARNQSGQRQKFIKDELILSMNNIFDLLKATNDTLKILCHCDLRPKNIFFKKVEDGQDSDSKIQCRFVDFQEVRYLPPAMDVLLFLYYNLREPILTDDIFTEYTKYSF